MLAGHGIDIAVNYNRSADAARDLCHDLTGFGVRAEPFQADVGSAEEATSLASAVWDAFGQIDILVNNAGPFVDDPYLKLDVADFDHVMDTNIRATYLVTKSAGRLMKQRGTGHVVNIAATNAFDRGGSVYGLAKAGVVHLTRQLALEMAPEVRVNSIAPGLIADNEGMAAHTEREAVEATPLGRLVTRAEIAQVLYFLCGSAFDSVTGQTIVMDGGLTVGQ